MQFIFLSYFFFPEISSIHDFNYCTVAQDIFTMEFNILHS